VTRHFITDHGSNPDNRAGDYHGDLASLEDEFLPPFQRFQMEGDAEGVMFSISALNGMAATANSYLYQKLQAWNTTCIRQTDCCGTFKNAVSTHKNFNTTEDAVAAAINAGLQLDYGDQVGADITNAIAAGKLSMQQLDSAVARAFLTRFRLGEFDDVRNPFFMRYDTALLDSAAHKAAARKAVAASAVLLKNAGDLLPLAATGLKKVAVIGPWINCKERAGGYGGSQGYLNNYKGQPSYISTILEAVLEEAVGGGFAVASSEGTAPGGMAANATLLAEAVAAVRDADVVVLALGLGNAVEGEGLDRTHLTFPPPQQALLAAVQQAVAQPVPGRGARRTKLVLAINSAGGVDTNYTELDAAVQLWFVSHTCRPNCFHC
jgi:beta-glucosidase-like glycosyl hydrolase